MSTISQGTVGGASAPSASGEEQVRHEQLRFIERTSVPGVASCAIGGVIVLIIAFLPGYAAIRASLLGTAASVFLMAILWGVAVRACRRGALGRAFNAQLLANLTATVLFFLFIDRGALLGMQTAFVGMSTGAMVLSDRAQRNVAVTTIAVVLSSAALHELRLVDPIVLPNYVLYGAVAVAVIFGFSTPISAFRVFNEHLRASRVEALRNEREAREARDRADAQARSLADVTAELRDFTYIVSHDLRAPLINIDGFGVVLRETLNDFDRRLGDVETTGDGPAEDLRAAWADSHAEVEESLHFISSGTAKMNGLIDGLLELSRIDSRPAQEVTVHLPALLGEIVASMEHQIRDRDIAVEIAPLPDIVGERLRVGQVFGNLIENAIKYMPERSPRAISVRCETGETEYIFSVNDSGHGIPVDYREKVFRPFKRLESGSGVIGEGLGLAAVKKIVDRCRGRIWVEDSPMGGASFRFTWPRSVPTPMPAVDHDDSAAA